MKSSARKNLTGVSTVTFSFGDGDECSCEGCCLFFRA